jgi:hypothetical protein
MDHNIPVTTSELRRFADELNSLSKFLKELSGHLYGRTDLVGREAANRSYELHFAVQELTVNLHDVARRDEQSD